MEEIKKGYLNENEVTFLLDKDSYRLINREYKTERSALPTIANSIIQITIFAILLCLEVVFDFLLTIYPPLLDFTS